MEDNRVPSFVAVDPAAASITNALRNKRKRGVVEEPQKAQKPRRKMIRRRGPNTAASKEIEVESLSVSEDKGLDTMELDADVAVTAGIIVEGKTDVEEPEEGDDKVATKTQGDVEENKIAEESENPKEPDGEEEEENSEIDDVKKPESDTEVLTGVTVANDDVEQPTKKKESMEETANPVSTEVTEKQEVAIAATAENETASTDESAEKEPTSTSIKTEKDVVDAAATDEKNELEENDSESDATTAIETDEPKVERKSWLASAFGKMFSFW
ncbi:hypothetical protein BX666DRAFT_2030610 [Dichotomocladium elegans]|nr:hypothetical protein BX666DRAFT_2030610 [Dichotomocladium elegans]